MARLFAILGALMSTHIASTHAGACLSICQQNSDDPTPCPPARPIPMPQNPLSSVCRNRLPEGEKWACEDEAIVFPTVECILADMKTCNNIGQNTVFYSFGVRANDVRINVRDKLSPKGVMFFDALDVTVRVIVTPFSYRQHHQFLLLTFLASGGMPCPCGFPSLATVTTFETYSPFSLLATPKRCQRALRE